MTAADYRPPTSRTDARTVACPYCHARAGELCQGPRGKLRESNHAERHLAAQTAIRKAELDEQRRTHPAELPLWEAPEPYHDAPADPGPGRVTRELDPGTCATGLAGVARAKAILDGHHHRSR